MSEFVISRQPSLWNSRLAKFKIWVDGDLVDAIKEGQAKVIAVPDGRHRVRVTDAWWRSSEVVIHVDDERPLRLTCGVTRDYPTVLDLLRRNGMLFLQIDHRYPAATLDAALVRSRLPQPGAAHPRGERTMHAPSSSLRARLWGWLVAALLWLALILIGVVRSSWPMWQRVIIALVPVLLVAGAGWRLRLTYRKRGGRGAADG